jgi:radical SAM superfamily enzyme YgiQ (UPF0313 family)
MSAPLSIALVRPPVIQRPASLSAYGAVPPIGLAYVAAALQDAGHRVTVVDAAGEALDAHARLDSPAGPLLRTGLSDRQILARIPEDADLIGVSHMFLHEWPLLRGLLHRLAQARPGARLMLGGENAAAFWRWLLPEAPPGTICVRGEGEAVVVQLAGRIAENASWDGIPGLAFLREGVPVTTGLAPRLGALADLPRPAWDLFPVEAYLSQRDPHGVHRGRSLPILATRGCPYTCTFCSSPAMWTTRYATRAPAAVVDEMRDMVARYGVENFNFCDLTAIVRRDWILEFCAELSRAQLDITWQLPTGTRSEALDAEVLAALAKTGCRNLTYAPESGSPRMLKVLQKRVRPARMLESLHAAHDAGLVTRINIIVGHPDERRDDLLASLRLLLRAARVGCDDAAVMIFTPYPGSADFQRLLEQGEVELSERYCYLALTRTGGLDRSWHPRWGPGRLHGVQLAMLLAFYGTAAARRPARLPRAALGLLTGQEQTQLDQLLRTKLAQLRRGLRARASAVPV